MFDELVAAIANCDVKMPNLLYLHLSAAFFISESWLGKTHRYTPGIATEEVIYRKLKISFFFLLSRSTNSVSSKSPMLPH